MKKKIRKSTWIPLAFVVYSAAVYAYVLPQSTASTSTIVLTIGLNLLVILALWWLYRKKEKLAEERERDMDRSDNRNDSQPTGIES